ncbi:Piwi-domain-containing protein [Exidia glandulosa HHB12029]|uniref:Piwi-domain-containing protein n=1 Tax=Exidia glandulosa HHB12029 TaxID=1314781 RepID=A0A165M4A1_EXIGL|nr:Piwi-domain-containing protein [Exidia glandulosa HHB12029]
MPPMRDPIAAEVANFPQRPPGPYGEGLKTFNAQANNFLVTQLPENMFHYDAIQPTSEREVTKPKARLLVHTMQVQNPTVFTGPLGAYDGRKNLYLSYEPNLNRTGARISVTLPPLQGQSSRVDEQFFIFIKWAAKVDLAALRDFVKGGPIQNLNQRRTAHQNSATAVMFINEMLRRIPVQSENWITVGRTFYTKNTQTVLKTSPLVLVPGYFLSVRPCLSGINVTVDSAVGVMYPEIALMELVFKFVPSAKNNTRKLFTRAPDSFLATAQGRDLGRSLKGVKVFANNNTRAKEIMGLVSCAKDYSFTDANGYSVTVEDYFMRAYNYTVKHPLVFCVQVGKNPNKAIVYPIELCTVMPGQLYRRTLAPDVTREMLKAKMNTMKPRERLADIQKGFRQLGFGDAARSGIEVQSTLLQVPARILQPPPPKMSKYTLAGKWFMRPRSIYSWGILSVFSSTSSKDEKTVKGFGTKLREVLIGMGMRVGHPKYSDIHVLGDIRTALAGLTVQLKEELAQELKKNPMILIVVVMPSGVAHVQHQVKFWGDVQAGMPTQCVNIEKVRTAEVEYLHNVAMKINVRTGGLNYMLVQDDVPWGNTPAMVVGADVSHPPASESNQPSVAAVCASMDGPACEYVATSRVQASRQEIITEFREMMAYLIVKFIDKRWSTRAAITARDRDDKAALLKAVWPSIILIYRDGVGEGQYCQVSDTETEAARAALRDVWSNAAAKQGWDENDAPRTTITYIVVSKKHHQRFFTDDVNNRAENGNCLPGSVFDLKVAHPTLFDFWLQSQAAIIGTARPAHYIVCHDEYRFTVDVLQKFSYALCYVYARATRSVSIPAPVYYADLICGRSRFMFDPTADNTSVASNDRYQTLEEWQAAYRQPHGNHRGVMYFI